jgi:anti-sigma regulatory factor (Ser/Thr protein kinase)
MDRTRRNSVADELALELPNDFESLSRLSPTVRGFLDRGSVPPDTIYTVALILEELVTNIIRHAYVDDAAHEISVRLSLEPRTVVIRVEDDGREFDPREAPPADLGGDLDSRQPGGLGVHLVREFAESLDYRRSDGRNVVEVRIAVPAS